MRLIGWGTLCGLALFVAPFTAVAVLGSLAQPSSLGFLLFSLPVVAVAGATAGVLGGALAAAVAPLARRGPEPVRAVALAAGVYVAALTVAVTVVFLLVVPAEWRSDQAPLVPVVTVIATGLATWGLADERRRASRAAVRPPDLAVRPGRQG